LELIDDKQVPKLKLLEHNNIYKDNKHHALVIEKTYEDKREELLL
jgi:hypothetical protein